MQSWQKADHGIYVYLLDRMNLLLLFLQSMNICAYACVHADVSINFQIYKEPEIKRLTQMYFILIDSYTLFMLFLLLYWFFIIFDYTHNIFLNVCFWVFFIKIQWQLNMYIFCESFIIFRLFINIDKILKILFTKFYKEQIVILLSSCPA